VTSMLEWLSLNSPAISSSVSSAWLRSCSHVSSTDELLPLPVESPLPFSESPLPSPLPFALPFALPFSFPFPFPLPESSSPPIQPARAMAPATPLVFKNVRLFWLPSNMVIPNNIFRH
jgi:hypothetical protein